MKAPKQHLYLTLTFQAALNLLDHVTQRLVKLEQKPVLIAESSLFLIPIKNYKLFKPSGK
jgi:hypothetical protein